MRLIEFKLIRKIFTIGICIISMISCSDMKEEIWVNTDGSGQYDIVMDMGSMLESMEGLKPSVSEDSEESIMVDDMEKMDTTINFFYDMPDSIRDQMDRPDLLKKATIHMVGDEAEKSMVMTTSFKFDNVSELHEIFSKMEEVNRLSGDNMDNDMMSPGVNKKSINFTFGNGVFKREDTNMEDLDEYKELGLGEEEMTSEQEDQLKVMMDQMLGSTEFKSIIHFPAEIISVSHPDYIVDGHDVIYSKPWKEILKMKIMPGVEIRYKNDKIKDMENSKFKIEKSESKDMYYLGVKGEVKLEDIAAFYQKNLPAIFGAATQAGAEIEGMPSGIYFSWDEASAITEMMAAVRLKSPMKIDGFETITVPSGNILTTDYYGSYDKLADVHNAFDAYISEHNYEQISVVIEEYVSDPTTVTPDKCLTKVSYFVK